VLVSDPGLSFAKKTERNTTRHPTNSSSTCWFAVHVFALWLEAFAEFLSLTPDQLRAEVEKQIPEPEDDHEGEEWKK
jgi:hypothetical protein